jgi:hypothetical protein
MRMVLSAGVFSFRAWWRTEILQADASWLEVVVL